MTDRFHQHTENPEAASAVSLLQQPAIRGVSLSVVNRHADITLESFDPFFDSATLTKTAECMVLLSRVLHSVAGKANLFRYAPETLSERHATMLSARHEGKVVGTIFCYRDKDDLVFAGAAVDPAYSGQRIASAMGAVGLLHDFTAFGPAREVKCVVRQYADEKTVNEASKISFSRLGLLERETGTHHLKGDYRDRHLFGSAQSADDGTVFIKYRTMCGGGTETLARARLFLTAWSRSILPLPRQIAI